jgi:aspartate oxidase
MVPNGSLWFPIPGCYIRRMKNTPPAIDVLSIGSGLAGQSLALHLADTHRVTLVTKKTLTDSASGWA